MQLHEVEEVKSVSTTSAANKALAEGWTLIAVVSDSGGGARYVFGTSKANTMKRAIQGLPVVQPVQDPE